MEIKQIDGDLLQSSANIIVHQVNCQGAFNSGIAKAIREKYHNVYEDYMSYVKNANCDLLGSVQFVKINENQYIANLFGQQTFGYSNMRYTSYDAVYDGLIAIKKHMIFNHFHNIAFPYGMSSVRGGANWNIIFKMIEEVFKDTETIIEIYKL